MKEKLPDIEAINKRFARLLQTTQNLPPAGSRPVTVAGKVGGWVGKQAMEAIDAVAGVRIEDEAVHIGAVPKQRLSLDNTLASIAYALQQGGCIRSWRNELLDVVAEGNTVARLERGAFRPLGMLTQTVHMNAWTADNCFWAARRALDKSTDPGMWDTLSGGLVGAGEDVQTALYRETYEEAGLDASATANSGRLRMVLRMHRRLSDGYQVENILVSDCILGKDIRPESIDGEVMEFRCLNLAELWDMIVNDAFTIEAELAILDSLQHKFKHL